MQPSINDYTINDMIAEGKHTIIYRARRKNDNTSVVIKLLKSEDSLLKNAKRLSHEFDLLSKLKTHRVVKAYDLVPIQNSLLMVMEDLQGSSPMDQLIEKEWTLTQKLDLAIEIATAIGDIHHQHIIHKDVKPQNILVKPETHEIKIIDFGIASQLSREVQQALMPEQIEGSIAYVSPEQTGRMNRPVDYRSDIYSLGVTLYQLFTHKLPFEANTPLELIHLHIAQQPIPPNEMDSTIPKVVSDIILKCMSKEAEHRYHSAFGLKYDLEMCRKQLSKNNSIPYFPLGKQDVYDHFHEPEKIFGRQKELNFIHECFQEVVEGSTILLTLNGYAGVGKSRLIHEAQRDYFSKRARFIMAKFDQFKRNIPYHGLTQAFSMLIQQILSESDENLELWRTRILEAVGSNGQILIDLIPEIKLIIGEQAPLEKTSPQDNANRFNYTLGSFLKALLLPESPLVIFFEDFQWADEPTLKLLEYFFGDPTIKYLLLIVAYRDNEIAPFHPMSVALQEITQKGGKVVDLPIKPLSMQSMKEMIRDSFYGPNVQTEELTSLLYKKNTGQPLLYHAAHSPPV